MASRIKASVTPQLLNEIDEDELEKYITDPNFCAQEKYDGVRKMIQIKGTEVIGINKKGLTVEVSSDIAEELGKLCIADTLDGEAFENHIVLFDYVMTAATYLDRYVLLKTIVKESDCIKIAPVAWTTQEKRDLLAKLKADNAEGIVFKNMHAKYTPGRPNSGGDQLKFKFCATATCKVTGGNLGKSSVSFCMFDDKGKSIEMGNVTVYPSQKCPKPGEFIEIKYLYAYKGGSLYQPVLLGKGDCSRKDVDISDCNIKQLKYKRE